jgi:hypothetical protein
MPDPDRDYAPLAIDEYSAGDDYGFGYTAVIAVRGLDPPIDLTRTRNYEYHFRYNTLLGCPLDALDCNDGVFCNGVEFCSFVQCEPGGSPCDDMDPCTSDSCSEALQSCSYGPPPAPPEVMKLEMRAAGPGSTVADLNWVAVTGADGYNVYRGESLDLMDLSCLAFQLPSTNFSDDGAIGESGMLLYLTTAMSCDLESTLGSDSAGDDRVNPSPCP